MRGGFVIGHVYTAAMTRGWRTFIELFIVFISVFSVVVWNDASRGTSNAFSLPLIKKPEPVTMLFAGDMMLGRYVGTLISLHGATYPFANITNNIASIAPDFFIANLEGPITSLNAPDARISPEQPYSMRFSFDPSVTSILKNVGLTHLSLANNHASDQGPQGINDTRTFLADADIASFGSRDGSALGSVASSTINGHDLAFIGLDTTTINHDPTTLRDALGAFPSSTFIVVFMHWGNEYEKVHSLEQEQFAHLLIDNGVDLIIGSHPHVVQDVEVYKEKAVFYSLGNFIFDQYWNAEVQTGEMLQVTLDEEGVTYQTLLMTSVRSQPFFDTTASTTAFSLPID
jgi:poly-gamma-glutamate synthesis protein (capsule biosynthesis protein)